MPLSAGSSSQAPCGGDLSTPNPIPHTPVRHPSSHDTPFCPDFVRRIRENTQRVREVRGEQQTLWGGFRRKRRSGENVPSPSPSPFSSEPPYKLCSSPCTPRSLCVFSRIWQTFSPLNLSLSSLPNPSRPLDALLSASASHRPPDTFPCLLNLQLLAAQLIRIRPTPSHAFRAYNCPPDVLLMAYTL